MKTSKTNEKLKSVAKRKRLFMAILLSCVVLAVGVVTAIAKYETRGKRSSQTSTAKTVPQPRNGYVTVEVGGKKIQVNALTLQQGPLTQEQSQDIADALKNNQSTEGLVEVRHADGTIGMDLQGRFQNVMLAKKNDDGSTSQACVDNADAARAFLQPGATSTSSGSSEPSRKAMVKE